MHFSGARKQPQSMLFWENEFGNGRCIVIFPQSIGVSGRFASRDILVVGQNRSKSGFLQSPMIIQKQTTTHDFHPPPSRLQKPGFCCRTMPFPERKFSYRKCTFLQKNASSYRQARFPAKKCCFTGAHGRKPHEIAAGFHRPRIKNAGQLSPKKVKNIA